MREFVWLADRDREDVIRETAARRDMHPTPVEKDFWVCWILRSLFGLPEIAPYILFKGGTSLSKAYHAIRRFSEDVDISVDRSVLGINPEEEFSKLTKSQRDNRIKRIKKKMREWVEDSMFPELKNSLSGALPKDGWELKLEDAEQDRHEIHFYYPPTLVERERSDYIRPYVLIELSGRSEHEPTEEKSISPFVAESFPNLFDEPEVEVKVLAARRTFWEKATILHAESSRPESEPSPARLARHAYDLWSLVQKGFEDAAFEDSDLLKRVCDHKALFYRQERVDYSLAYNGKLSLAPRGNRVIELKEDYQDMKDFFFGEPPSFEKLVDELKRIEARCNGVKP